MQLKWGVVGSRTKVQSEKFVSEFSLGDHVRTYGSQDEVWQDPRVWTSSTLAPSNKHVLCEKQKPMPINETGAREIVETAKKFKMEAI